MHPFRLLSLSLSLFSLTTIAEINGRCSGPDAAGVWETTGICITTATCSEYGGEANSAGCPDDPEDVVCCVIGTPREAAPSQEVESAWTATAPPKAEL
jgi:hypothetical protein